MSNQGLDVAAVRKDFPILEREVNGRPLVYLDSSNTSQKPRQVIDAIVDHYENHNANVARAVHVLGEEATAAFEAARDKIAAFIGAPSRDEVVFTKNASEAINLVARSLGDLPAGSPHHLGPGDEILITEMEHHSNIVPWQLLAQRTGATLRWLSIDDEGRLELGSLDERLNPRTKVVSVVHQSNILGTINPVARIAARAREVGALILVDGSQAAPHLPVDVRALGVDFYAFTGHKMCGPTGIGVLWGRHDVLGDMPPFLGGGEMIADVTMERSTYADLPHRFEAGTPPIAQAIGLGAAVDYLTKIGMDAVHAHDTDITGYALERLKSIDSLRIIGPKDMTDRGAAVSFALADIHPHDVGQVLDELGIAVRVGHHCARPVCLRYGVPATTRASFYLYTTRDEIDALVEGLEHVKRFFRAA
jgi:cysteine desulfurase / selenocysteine lyase